MALEYLPVTVEELIEKLDEEFPRRPLGAADLDRTDRELWFEAGRRAVVELLLDLQAEGHDPDV